MAQKAVLRSKQKLRRGGYWAREGLHLTKRVKEFGRLPPPESSIFVGDHIMGLVLVKFIVERHLIQETIHLPTHRKKSSRTLTSGTCKGSHICSALLVRLSDSQTSHKPATVTLLRIASMLLANPQHPLTLSSRPLTPQTAGSQQ